MSDFPKKLEVVLSTSDQIIAWGLAIAFVAALYLVAFVIGYGLTGLLFPKPARPSPPAPPQSRPSLRDRSFMTPSEHSITESPVRATFKGTAGQRPAWISVEERMPELHVSVLCSGEGGVWIGQREEYEWFFPGANEMGTPTHWMPLPQPPVPKKEI
jgi:hypothetical protein